MPEQIASNNQDSNIIELLKSFSEITDPDFIQFGRHLREFKAQLFAVFPDGQRVELYVPPPQE